jgi:hypothetical protein
MADSLLMSGCAHGKASTDRHHNPKGTAQTRARESDVCWRILVDWTRREDARFFILLSSFLRIDQKHMWIYEYMNYAVVVEGFVLR